MISHYQRGRGIQSKGEESGKGVEFSDVLKVAWAEIEPSMKNTGEIELVFAN